MLDVVMLSVFELRVVMLDVVMLSVEAPFQAPDYIYFVRCC
jgi:hypothetical protein